MNTTPPPKSTTLGLDILLVSMFCATPLCSLYAQGQTVVEQPNAASHAEQKSPSPTPTVSPTIAASATPSTRLNIDEIRAKLPSLTADRFDYLRRLRKSTLDTIEDESLQIKKLTSSIDLLQKRSSAPFASFLPSGEQLEKAKTQATDDLAKANKALSAAITKRGVSDSELQRLQSDVRAKQELVERIDSSISRLPAEEQRKRDADAAAKTAAADLSQARAELDKLTQSQTSDLRLLGQIDDMVNQLFISSDAANSFKLKMSIAFAGLVAVVIGGFFWIAFSNEEVKKAIFSNEAGIQFITLFAIVIAVILFGIIGILEGKELSALLGGLSGYILGRTRA
jgi:hypothetical protein